MSGIIIQAEKVYPEMSIFGATVDTAIIIAVIIMLIYVAVSEFKSGASTKWGTLLLSVLLSVFGLLTCRGFYDATNTIHTDLVVTVDDTVGFNEFNSKYTILSRSGNLYTVRELQIEDMGDGDNE